MSSRTCMEAALAKLNYRMRTVSELRRMLLELGYEAEETEETLEELKEFGYLDDLRYASEFFRSSRRKNWSRARIIRTLKEKGISGELAARAIGELESSEDASLTGISFDERETALKAGVKMAESQIRGGRPIDENFLRKVARRLTSLGYDPGCCYYVINRLRDQKDSFEEEDLI